MSYPVAGLVRDYFPEGYPHDHAMVPHGMSVILNAPAVVRFTAPANPERHLQAAAFLGADVDGASPDDAGEILPKAIIGIMKKTGMPNGLKAVGFTENDLDDLVKGTVPQHRVTKLSPRPASEADLRQLFVDSMTIW
jgi:hydroxyacid-oxoacid transhydrogenase